MKPAIRRMASLPFLFLLLPTLLNYFLPAKAEGSHYLHEIEELIIIPKSLGTRKGGQPASSVLSPAS